jgi:hypothetical protein
MIVVVILLAIYVGGYFIAADREGLSSLAGGSDTLYLGFRRQWQCRLYYPMAWAEAAIRRRPLFVEQFPPGEW